MHRILIVDDEPHLALLASLALQKAGFLTVTATSARQALNLAFTEQFDLLLTDCVMPDLFGPELAGKFLERRPSLPVVFMSGNTPASLDTTIRLETGVNFIQKPFESQDLVGTIRRALEPAHA